MSLDFNLTAVKARLGDERYHVVTTSVLTRDLPADEWQWHPVTNRLIWLTLIVGLSDITEANIDEWCFRVTLLEKLDGPQFKSSDDRTVCMTRKDIENHIGLHTNATPEKRHPWVLRTIASSRMVLAAGDDGSSAGELIDRITLEA